MTITRLWNASAETQDTIEFVKYQSDVPAVSSTKARTGTYSWRVSSTQKAFGTAFAVDQDSLRLGYALNHNSPGAAEDRLILCAFRNALTEVVVIYWDATTGIVSLEVDGSEVDSVSAFASGLAATDTWHEIGVTAKKHASAGFASLYINGVQMLNYVGNVPSAFDNLVVHQGDTQGWANFAYYDDLFCDNIDGENDSAPPSIYFLHALVDGAGSDADWTPVGAGSNYQAVDDAAANDGDSTYVKALSAALRDSYTLGDVTVPADFEISAVVAYSVGKRLDAATESTYSMGFFDGANTDDGTQQSGLPTAYGYRTERFPLQPDGSAWNEADFNGMEYTLLSGGSF